MPVPPPSSQAFLGAAGQPLAQPGRRQALRQLGRLGGWAGATWALAGLGCGQPDAPARPRASGLRPVSLLHYFDTALGSGPDTVEPLFNQSQSQYVLKSAALDHEAFKTRIRTTLREGHPPDLYSYWAGARTNAVLPELQPLDALWQSAGLDAVFPAALVETACRYQGQHYLLPMTQHYVGMFYNTALFAQHGLTPPRTWAQFVQVCHRLKAAGITPIALGARDKWPAQFWFDYLLLRSAQHGFRQRLMQGQASYTDARVQHVFALWAELLAHGFFNTDPNDLDYADGAAAMVAQGRAAMTLMGSWVSAYFSGAPHGWQAGRDFDFFPFPVMDADLPSVALGPVDGLIQPRRAHNPAGAQQVLAFFASVPAQQTISQHTGALAASQQVPATAYNPMQQRMRQDIAQAAHFAFNYDLATTPAVANLGLNALTEFLAFPESPTLLLKQLQRDVQAATAVQEPAA